MSRLLSDIEIQRALSHRTGWTRRGQELHRTFVRDGFPGAVAFIERLVAPAEEMQHHPDVDLRYNQVLVRLSTHDAGGITQQDFDLAARIDALA